MSSSRPTTTTTTDAAAQQSYFLNQRAMFVSEIAQVCFAFAQITLFASHISCRANIFFGPSKSLDSVLTNINRLNRSLEAIIAVGNEFSSVEGLWSTFETVMADQDGPEGERKE
jgi:hypothetical protein